MAIPKLLSSAVKKLILRGLIMLYKNDSLNRMTSTQLFYYRRTQKMQEDKKNNKR